MQALIPQAEFQNCDELAQQVWRKQEEEHGRMTNMKRTLAHSGLALDIMMKWYPIKEQVASFFGERATILFVHAVSVGTDCLICSTFFRRILIDWGEDPDALQLNETEQTLVDFGTAIGAQNQSTTGKSPVPPKTAEKVRAMLNDRQFTELITLAGMMVATNLFNNIVQVELDDYLMDYKAKSQ